MKRADVIIAGLVIAGVFGAVFAGQVVSQAEFSLQSGDAVAVGAACSGEHASTTYAGACPAKDEEKCAPNSGIHFYMCSSSTCGEQQTVTVPEQECNGLYREACSSSDGNEPDYSEPGDAVTTTVIGGCGTRRVYGCKKDGANGNDTILALCGICNNGQIVTYVKYKCVEDEDDPKYDPSYGVTCGDRPSTNSGGC